MKGLVDESIRLQKHNKQQERERDAQEQKNFNGLWKDKI